MSASTLNAPSQTAKPKGGRSAISCVECQRRKQKCSREWPCNHCQARKVPHLCHFASQNLSSGSLAQPIKKRKEDSSELESHASSDDAVHGITEGLARMGYMPGHDVFSLASCGSSLASQRHGSEPFQSEQIEAALQCMLSKPYTDVLIQNYLDNANYQYYPIFPEQLRNQNTSWWEDRAAGRRLSPELTCLLVRVCAVSMQYLDVALAHRLEFELGEKPQVLSERFHAAAKKLSTFIGRGTGGIIQVQQLFLESSWWKSEANTVESWHSLGSAIREAQEIGMHKKSENLPNFEREMLKRLWCILWTWDWQMSNLLSRPLLIDQSAQTLQIADGCLENLPDPEIPHPLSSVTLQATLGLHVSRLIQRLGTEPSIPLVLEIEDALEAWMTTFPRALRDQNPDTQWDEEYPYIPFMRCQVNVIAYCYMLGPLKIVLLDDTRPKAETADQTVENLRAKGVDACLNYLRASARFYKLVFPRSIKYFFIIFFIFDAATVLSAAILRDAPTRTLPKRAECVRGLRAAQELLDRVSGLSEAARISAALLRKLIRGPLVSSLDAHEKQVLGLVEPISPVAEKKPRLQPPPPPYSMAAGSGYMDGMMAVPLSSPDIHTDGSSASSTGTGPSPYEMPSGAFGQGSLPQAPSVHAPHSAAGGLPPAGWDWHFTGYATTTTTTRRTTTTAGGGGGGGFVMDGGAFHGLGDLGNNEAGMALGDHHVAGSYLEPFWGWERLNLDLGTWRFGN